MEAKQVLRAGLDRGTGTGGVVATMKKGQTRPVTTSGSGSAGAGSVLAAIMLVLFTAVVGTLVWINENGFTVGLTAIALGWVLGLFVFGRVNRTVATLKAETTAQGARLDELAEASSVLSGTRQELTDLRAASATLERERNAALAALSAAQTDRDAALNDLALLRQERDAARADVARLTADAVTRPPIAALPPTLLQAVLNLDMGVQALEAAAPADARSAAALKRVRGAITEIVQILDSA